MALYLPNEEMVIGLNLSQRAWSGTYYNAHSRWDRFEHLANVEISDELHAALVRFQHANFYHGLLQLRPEVGPKASRTELSKAAAKLKRA